MLKYVLAHGILLVILFFQPNIALLGHMFYLMDQILTLVGSLSIARDIGICFICIYICKYHYYQCFTDKNILFNKKCEICTLHVRQF